MNENNIHTFNIDGNIRSNIFNKRRSTKYFVEKNTEEKIFFYNVDEEFGFLSNFSDHPIFCGNKIWKTTEHYFQAQKFINTELEEKIRLSYTPSKAKDIAKLNKSKRLKNWDDIKDSVMYEALYAKFTQHPDLRLMLLNTKEKELCEHCSNDFYWADGRDGSGKNILGKLLMKVRNKIKMVSN
ncbi:MAG: NADAR family protein [Campylobacteraceae bacterium]|nr:NADAR family protein [Campylobacteraceae bacterium]